MNLFFSLPQYDILFPCIFSYFSIVELFKLRLVSKSFRGLIDNYFTQCREYDFSKMKNKFSSDAFRLMTAGNTSLLRLCLADATHWITDDLLLPVITSSKRLEFIDLTHCSCLSNDVISALASHCHCLTAISLKDCHWLNKLLASSCCKLQYLDVSSCWSLDDESVCFCACSCSELETIKLTNIYAITNDSLAAIASSCPKLKVLSVKGCWRVTNDGIRLIGEYCRKLHTLFVDDCRDVSEASLARLRVKGIEIDVAATSFDTLQRLENSFRYVRPYINFHI